MFDINYILLLRRRNIRVYSVNTMTEEKQLIDEIKTFCERHQMAFTTFGRNVFNNPNFYDDLFEERDAGGELIKEGRSPSMKTLRKMRAWMKNENIKLRGKKNA